MKVQAMRSVAAATLLLLVGCATTAEAPINARGYSCDELIQLVQERKNIYLKGFLGTQSSVYSSAEACTKHEYPVKSAWRTRDVFSCVIGYRCMSSIEREDNFFRSDI